MRKHWLPFVLLGIFAVVMVAIELNKRFTKNHNVEVALIVIDVIALIAFVVWLVREWPRRRRHPGSMPTDGRRRGLPGEARRYSKPVSSTPPHRDDLN
jgi:cyanate permease